MLCVSAYLLCSSAYSLCGSTYLLVRWHIFSCAVARILLCGAVFLVLFTLNNIMYRVAAITLTKKFLESDKLRDCLNGRPIIVLCGTMMKPQRTAALNRIRSGEINIVLLSFGVGSVGHNFQMFSEVFFLDRN